MTPEVSSIFSDSNQSPQKLNSGQCAVGELGSSELEHCYGSLTKFTHNTLLVGY